MKFIKFKKAILSVYTLKEKKIVSLNLINCIKIKAQLFLLDYLKQKWIIDLKKLFSLCIIVFDYVFCEYKKKSKTKNAVALQHRCV